MSEDLEIRQLPSHPGMGRTIAVFDPRSRQHPASTLFSADEPLKSKIHRRSFRALDQGRTSECVIYSGKGMVNTVPLRAVIPSKDRLRLETTPVYKLAQTMDPWPGEDYDGTSVLAGAKALRQLGLIDSYRWCFGIEDVKRTLSSYGPVTIGVSWYESMFYPEGARAYLNVNPGSGLAGGHAVQLIGIDVADESVIMANSWGESWGDRGRARLRWTDLDHLLEDYGEAYTYTAA